MSYTQARLDAALATVEELAAEFISLRSLMAEQRFCEPPVAGSSPAAGFLTAEEREAVESAITLRLCDAKWEEDRNGMADNARARKAKREADTLLKLLERLK